MEDLVDVAVAAADEAARRAIRPTATWATSGWLSAHASSPPPVAIAVESPVITMRTGRDIPVGNGGTA